MEHVESWGGKQIYYGRRELVGRAEDYRDPVDGVAHLMLSLLREFVDGGGNIEAVQLTSAVETRGSGRAGVVVTLHGYGPSS